MISTTLVALAIPIAVLILIRVGGSLMSDEVKGWLPYAGRALLRSSARRLPEAERPRWEEEWQAEHAARIDRPLTALAFALRVRLKARATASELRPLDEVWQEGAGIEQQSPETSVRRPDDKEALSQALEFLSYRERRVIELRYGLGGEHRRSHDEIGQTFNVTGARIKEIESLSLKKLQSVAEAQKLRDVA